MERECKVVLCEGGIWECQREELIKERDALRAELESARNKALDDAAALFDRWKHHDQTYRGGVNDECMLSFRVMDIIAENILALKNK